MSNYIGLDVSLKTTSICILDATGKIVKQMIADTNPEAIYNAINALSLEIEKVAIECGGTSHWLAKNLKKLGLPAICIDSRKMAAAISIRANKTDKNDAFEIADALRSNYYKEVYQKQDHIVEKQTLLTARRTLIDQRTKNINCIKGLLKHHGILDCKGGDNTEKFIITVKSAIENLANEVRISINALLNTMRCISYEVDQIDSAIAKISESDEDVQLLMTIPGVGVVTALTFKLEIDDPSRFKKSRSVGAYVGMAPKQYSSGETKNQGGISKMGSNELRALLSQSALSIMYNVKQWNLLKLFGLRIKRKHGHRKAIVALGRKLAVVMHRMWIDKKPFQPGNVEKKEIDKLFKLSKREEKKMEKAKKIKV